MSWVPSSQWGMQNFGTGASTDFGAFQPNSGFGSGMGGAGSPSGSGFQLGWNMPTLQMGLQGLNSIGNIWGAWQSNKLARDQLNFTKRIANANLNNQISAYNTALEDRARARAAVEGQSSAEEQAYIDKNRLGDNG